MVKRIIHLMFLSMLVFSNGLAFDFGEIGKKIEEVGAEAEKFGVDLGVELDNLTQPLSWDALNLSLTADMTNTTETLGRKVQVDSKVYKRGATSIRIDAKTAIQVPQAQDTVQLKGFYILRYPLKKEAYLVLPAKKAYMEQDPEKSREMLGELKEKLDDKSSEIEKKERLGKEEMAGYQCDKFHVIMTLANGTRSDITSWLAEDLNGFPVKIISKSKTPQGLTAVNTTLFSNIEKTTPAPSLFEIPEDYVECKNIVELVTGGKFGKRLKKRGEKKKRFRRK